jgi:hypothetical protein
MPAKKVTKKVAAKKTTAKKAIKKVAPDKTTKDPVAKKAAKKPAAKKSSTVIIVKYDAGMGNSIMLRGDGPGLSWDTGTIMENIDAETWKWTTSKANKAFEVKFLINDTAWAQGENTTVKPGTTSGFNPVF